VPAAAHTRSVEDYLKAIYDLSRATGNATASHVAARLAVARASVSAMVRRLTDQGLVAHEPYRGLRLTREGRAVALQLLRRHRVLEAYLVTALGYGWDRVHDEAERLEHSVSDELINRMAAAIGEPTADPHGAPIPTARGTLTEPAYRSLGELAVGEEARIAHVEDDDGEILRYLASLRLVPGARVRYLGREPFGGSLAFRVGSRTRRVTPSLAGRVFVNE
jgi:DtxR family transcriptional regulator, Mn-dependent transcriptional regulator